MLFSREDVAACINRFFEPAWEMVRPVPVVRVDFGNNHVITRTLHGNIATYVCSADGAVLDILPGIYAPSAYIQALDQFRLLAQYVKLDGKLPRTGRLKEYHQSCVEALKKSVPAPVLVNTAGISKAVIERSMVVLLASKDAAQFPSEREPVALKAVREPNALLNSAEDLENWKLLVDDTKLNETGRRRQIHEMLADLGNVKPDEVKKRVYKEVLHSDLDDPYLGLGNLLFANYPFAKEDKTP